MAMCEPSVGGRTHRTNEDWLRGSRDLWPEQEWMAVPLEGRQDCGGSNWAGKTLRSISSGRGHGLRGSGGGSWCRKSWTQKLGLQDHGNEWDHLGD